MATQTIRFLAEPGLTLKARLYPVASSTPFAAQADCTEDARGGIYTFTVTSSSGKYQFSLRNVTGGLDELLGWLYVKTTDTAAMFDAREQRYDLDLADDLIAHGDANWGGSADLTDIETALEEIKASLAAIAGAGLPSAGGGVDPSKLTYYVGQTIAKTITLSSNPDADVAMTWEKLNGTNLGTQTVSASSTSISVTNPSGVTENATSGRWSVKTAAGTPLASGTFEVAELAR